ncbi:phosphopantothenate--cysteine ligase [Enterococcus casseliflavus]|uniref:phosphopantothenate--cysteine ligase n=1 Tax=Enterococcus casseliflavus TaxID=37734 RepID=UPI003D6A3B44
MRILITAGGTSEKIDDVRAITNHSTGSLGQAIAKEWLQYPEVAIDYVTTKTAKQPPTDPCVTCHFIEGTTDLLTQLTDLLTTHSYAAVIHSMAVSDFTPAAHFSEAAFYEAINDALPTYDNQVTPALMAHVLSQSESTAGKVSSNTDHLFLVLKKTPKVIQTIKALQPTTLLVGFKLLVDVAEAELFAVARKSLLASQADYVLANDLTQISGNQHVGHLLTQEGQIGTGRTKAEIATLIVDTLRNDLRA